MDDKVRAAFRLVDFRYTDEDGDKYFSLLGRCITQWAKIDRLIFKLCSRVLETDEKFAAIIYYRIKTIGSRRQLVEELCAAGMTEETNRRLKPFWDFIESNLWMRNALAHYPTQIYWPQEIDLENPKPMVAVGEPHSITEPNEVLTGKEEKRIVLKDLEDHLSLVTAAYEQFRRTVLLGATIRELERRKASQLNAEPSPAQPATPPAQEGPSPDDQEPRR